MVRAGPHETPGETTNRPDYRSGDLMNCLESLDVPTGVTSVVGSGGKTTLLRAIAEELAARDESVVLATTTHFLAFAGVPLVTSDDEGELANALGRGGVACVGVPVASRGGRDETRSAVVGDQAAAGAAGGQATAGAVRALPKLGPSPIPVARLAQLAGHVLVEADGSRRLPLKAHAAHEPVVPPESTLRVLVVGASGLGSPVRKAAHRPELFCERASCAPDDAATPELVARVISAEVTAGLLSPDRVVVNQVEDAAARAQAGRLARELARLGVGAPVLAGSIRAHDLERIG